MSSSTNQTTSTALPLYETTALCGGTGQCRSQALGRHSGFEEAVSEKCPHDGTNPNTVPVDVHSR